jgi:CHAD domain-containing protein
MLTIEELCARYDNETVHTAHVAALAVQLFDATYLWLGLPRSLRKLIAAAAQLHDVGYRDDPAHHGERSAAIVGRTALRGLTRAQRRDVAAAIPFHSGRLTGITAKPPRVQAIAAFLRLADGLDHGHIQDAAIVKVERAHRVIRVVVRNDHFPYNLTQADRKADLWRAVFPLNIRFVRARTRGSVSAPLVTAATPVAEAARRLLSRQFKIITINTDAAVTGDSREPLHDIRVAIRRLRALLRAFADHLPKAERQRLDAVLKELNRDLGAARDLDVWLDFLESTEAQALLARSRFGPRYLDHYRRRRRLRQETVWRCLKGAHFAALRRLMARWLRVDLPAAARNEEPGGLPRLAADRIKKALRPARKWSRWWGSNEPDELHQLRIALRKVRYFGEFFGPVWGEPLIRFTQRVHAVEQALAKIHDIDVGLQRLPHDGPTPPRALANLLRQQRQAQAQKLEAAWKRFIKSGWQKRLKRAFRETGN